MHTTGSCDHKCTVWLTHTILTGFPGSRSEIYRNMVGGVCGISPNANSSQEKIFEKEEPWVALSSIEHHQPRSQAKQPYYTEENSSLPNNFYIKCKENT